ncbi:MAG: 3-deoxy-D-manno-octulosonic acid transferase [Pseudomonadota bacterium]|nr:3-deoxy-D-manno-octulosonic acid transferase [Pseudomonadota bacterium]
MRWRSRSEPLYGVALGERFGLYPRRSDGDGDGYIWIHAVSLGETRAAVPLIEAVRSHLPGARLLLTHGTATGRAAGQPLMRGSDRQAWLPFDTPGAVRRFLARYRPCVGILMETEIWPSLLAAAAARGVPMVLANARLSERSRRRGARFDAVLRPAFASLALALAQSEADAGRLRDAGVARVRVAGNLKFDLTPDPALLALGARWKTLAARPVVVFAQSREGEEATLLNSWRAVQGERPLLVIVPRHPQRFDAVASLVTSADFTLARRSRWPADASPPPEASTCDVWLGDSMLELPAYYALAQVALLGGSFEPLGGQNLIEAAACGCPLIMGPHTFNFAEAARLAVSAGAAEEAASLSDAIALALGHLEDGSLSRRAAAAHAFAAAHRGAAETTVQAVLELIRARSAAA